jgi:8-oxo-dGTP pyrophosphatase MutT (NUDIX family)
VVINQNAVAVIARLNRRGGLDWCLPKGHLEPGETPEQAAVREVEEETGLTTRIERFLGVIDYYFVVGDYRIHKVVHHFAFRKTGGGFALRKDPDHEVLRIMWVPGSKLQTTLTYPNERKIVHMLQTARA